MTGFVDPKQIDRLNPPNYYEDNFTDELQETLGPIGWIDDVLEKFFDFSFLKVVVREVGGDYTQLKRIGDAWNDLRWATADIEENMASGYRELDPHWNGNAAQAFEKYIKLWSQSLGQNETACRTVRDELHELSDNIGEFVKTGLSAVKLVVGLLEFPAAAPLKLIWNADKIIETIDNLIKLVNLLNDGVTAIIGFLEALTGEGTSTEIPEVNVHVPAKPYGGPAAPGV